MTDRPSLTALATRSTSTTHATNRAQAARNNPNLTGCHLGIRSEVLDQDGSTVAAAPTPATLATNFARAALSSGVCDIIQI